MLIGGMKPDRELHDTVIDLQETTGVAMSIHKRLQVRQINPSILYSERLCDFVLQCSVRFWQINLDLKANPLISVLNDVRANIFPVIWVDEGSEIDEANVELFKDMFETPIKLVMAFEYGFCFAFGTLLLSGGVVLAMMVKKKEYGKLEES